MDATHTGASAGRAGAGGGPGRAGAAELRQRRVRLARESNAAALARDEVRAAIGSWEVPVDTDVAALLASDLVTNAIRLGEGDRITLTISCTTGSCTTGSRTTGSGTTGSRTTGSGTTGSGNRGRLRVDLYDDWRVLPSEAAGASSAAGPGLALIATLADEWGTLRTPAGTAVYFALDYEPGDYEPVDYERGGR